MNCRISLRNNNQSIFDLKKNKIEKMIIRINHFGLILRHAGNITSWRVNAAISHS